ncbi:TM2 domain-containing protein [Celerinatantimonas sp. YJH-8]|uniref:TM2 domain-containing protein n=1 Tax=Celerinatantimonas sp. YJH-8 TaxID=3228714 RepID=UPI0038C78F19
MKGTILEFNESTRTGIISGEDGNRYSLDMEQWNGGSLPKSGTKVDFSVNGEQATSIYMISSGNGSSKKIAAAILAFFLGGFGAHKFYLGYTKQGVIMLLIFLFGFILIGIPSMIIGIIAFIEFIIYLTKSDEEFERIYVTGKKPWF